MRKREAQVLKRGIAKADRLGDTEKANRLEAELIGFQLEALREQVRHDIEQSYLDLGIPELRVMFNPGREQLALIDRGSPAASEVAQTVTTMEDLHRERTQLEALKRQKAELDLRLREAERANQMWA